MAVCNKDARETARPTSSYVSPGLVCPESRRSPLKELGGGVRGDAGWPRARSVRIRTDLVRRGEKIKEKSNVFKFLLILDYQKKYNF